MSREDAMKPQVTQMLKGIERYNPENHRLLENYVDYQVQENFYNLEANLAVLKLYQFNPTLFKADIVTSILLKALTSLPHTDFVLCKCQIDLFSIAEEPDNQNIKALLHVHTLLETCQFKEFWAFINDQRKIWDRVIGFEEAIRKYIAHMIKIAYQRIDKATLLELLDIKNLQDVIKSNNWTDEGDFVFIGNKEENIKTKNITEKIDFEAVSTVIAAYR